MDHSLGSRGTPDRGVRCADYRQRLDAALVVHPVVVGGDVIGRVAQLHLPRQDRDSEGGAMRNEMRALIGIGRVGGVAQGQFQTQLAVEIGGFEMHVAKDRFFLGGGLGVDVVADLGLEVRGHLGAAARAARPGAPGASGTL